MNSASVSLLNAIVVANTESGTATAGTMGGVAFSTSDASSTVAYSNVYDNDVADYTGMDEAKVIAQAARIEDYTVLGDFCMGQGLVGLAAYDAGKPFVGTELNQRRLAVLLQKLAKRGAVIAL